MEDNTNNKLSNLLASFDKKAEKIKVEAVKAANADQQFLQDFQVFTNDVVKPAMTEIGDAIQSSGHRYFISQEDEHKDDNGVTTDARIKMEIVVKGTQKAGYREHNPHVMFIAEKYAKHIRIHVNTIGPASGGSAGLTPEKYKISELTSAKVEAEIVEAISQIL